LKAPNVVDKSHLIQVRPIQGDPPSGQMFTLAGFLKITEVAKMFVRISS
jgi:hypothetical protein